MASHQSDLFASGTENDEENIVIDLADEDDDEDDDDGQEDEELGEENGLVNEDEGEHETTNEVRRRRFDETTSARTILREQEHENNNNATKTIGNNNNNNNYDNDKRFSVGDLIWFDPNQLGYSIPGKVLDFYPELMVLTIEGCGQPASGCNKHELDHNENDYNAHAKADEILQTYELSDPQLFRSIKRREPICTEDGHRDLVGLEDPCLESMIWNLKLRFKQDLIYTQCGKKILFSVNPYKQLDDLYNVKQVNKYDTISNWLTTKRDQLVALSNDFEAASLGEGRRSLRFLKWLLLNVQEDLVPNKQQQTSQNNCNPLKQDKQTYVANKVPHLFSLANEALKCMLTTGQDQSFLLLGDSGAGKTEACKLLVQYFATINKSPENLMSELILESIQMLESFGNAKTLLNSNSSRFGKMLEINFNLLNGFILDAKLVDLNLLDRARIVCQTEGERNFHVLYELLSGLSAAEKEKYGLETAKKYFYLNQGNCLEIESTNTQEVAKDDAEDFRSLCASMQVLGFNYEEQDTIFRILASILHLGNIYFHRKVLAVRSGGKLANTGATNGQRAASNGIEGVEIGSDTELRWVSHLLQIQFEHVMRCLTVRTCETAGLQATDCIVTPLNIDQALDTRDAIARALYSCLFKWLVQRVNAAINGTSLQASSSTSADLHKADQKVSQKAQNEPIYLSRTSESLCEFQPDKLRHRPANGRHSSLLDLNKRAAANKATVFLLDAFGFENLAENQFEQLCINYSAELLNHHFQRHLVRLEQLEYAREKLKWTPIGFILNEQFNATSDLLCSTLDSTRLGSSSGGSLQARGSNSIVNLISRKPLGILTLLDDECNFPKATDQSFAEKCHHNHALNDNYQCARLASSAGHEFGIRHFGQQSRMVWYQVDGFVEKNRDSLRPDVLELLLGSRMSLIVDMLQKMHLKQTATSGANNNNCDNYGSISNSSSSAKTLSRTYDGRYVAMKPRATTAAARYLDALHNNKALESIGATQTLGNLCSEQQSRQGSLRSLAASSYSQCAKAISSSGQQPNAWFIVCLKPNRSRQANLFDVPYVQEQARSFALIDIVLQRKFGYPVRMRFLDFIKRYKCFVSRKFWNNFDLANVLGGACGQKSTNKKQQSNEFDRQTLRKLKEICCSIIEFQFHSRRLKQELLLRVKNSKGTKPLNQYQCGLSKIFLNETLFQELECWRADAYVQAIRRIQKTWRMWTIRREFFSLRAATICLQSNWRRFIARRQYLNQLSAIICLQLNWRQVLSRRRQRALEIRRRELKQRQQFEMQQLQAEQSKQANKLRFRSHLNQITTSKQKFASSSSSSTTCSIYANRPAGLLDIPEDLAQLYRLQQQTSWLPVHDLTNLDQIDLSELVEREKMRLHLNNGKCKYLNNSAPFVVTKSSGLQQKEDEGNKWKLVCDYLDSLDLNERYSLQHFFVKYFPNEVPQIGYSRLPITRPFTYVKLLQLKRQAIVRANRRSQQFSEILDQKREAQLVHRRFLALEQKAIAVYKLILRFIDSDQSFMAARTESTLLDLIKSDSAQHDNVLQKLLKFKLISDYISYMCLTEPLLRDEIFLQITSQTWQNKRPNSLENTWKLMLNCLTCFEPLDTRLSKFLLKYSSTYCCTKYRDQVCIRLFEAIKRAEENKEQLRVWAPKEVRGFRREQELTEALSLQRKLPATILEYWSQQIGCDRLALAVSCHADDYSLNADGLQKPDEEENDQEFGPNLAMNYSNKTLVCLESRSSAQEVAKKLLNERQIPMANQFGWSLEIQHEGELSDFSSRLRGDDYVLDHFARLELLPELVQLIDDDLDSFESEQLGDEIGLLAALSHATSEQQAPSQNEQTIQLDDCCSACELEPNAPPLDDRSCGFFAQNQCYSNRAQNATLRSSRRHSATNSDTGTMRSRPSSLNYYRPGGLARANALRDQQANNNQDPLYERHMYQSNRRSMSMQELQLASGSALNGRYFQNYTQKATDEQLAACQDYDCCASSSGQFAMFSGHTRRPLYRGRPKSGSLRQLDQQHYKQANIYYSPSDHTGGNAASFQQCKRSSTPNSANGTRQSSSAYGSQSSRNVAASSMGSSGGRPLLMTRQRARRSSSNNQRLIANGAQLRGPPEYAHSTQSDYERIAPAADARNRKQQRRAPRQPQPLYAVSSAKSDTSEAPSLASHVRAVKAPQTNGDLDRYLDDLFNPLLDDCKDLDELSDIRSLAASIRGTKDEEAELRQQEKDFLGKLCDPNQLSRMIRGTDQEEQPADVDADAYVAGQETNGERQRADLSPTFESLIKSLKAQQQQVVDELGALEGQKTAETTLEGAELNSMSLSELKSLNEQLESRIQEAKSARNSMQINASSLASCSTQEHRPPVAPPEPSFASQQQQLDDGDIYSRAKTIRIGKWRWPPAREQVEGAEAVKQESQASKRASILSGCSDSASKSLNSGDSIESAATSERTLDDGGAQIGRLKISCQMKAKLEQLTNSSPPPPPPPPPVASNTLSGEKKLANEASELPKRLTDQRRHLLENQLSGATKQPERHSDGSQVSKVLAAKQQLAAAAGLALSALDSTPAVSQSSSRRQSGQIVAIVAAQARQDELKAQELGPRSEAAIRQRQEFYRNSSEVLVPVEGATQSGEIAKDKEKPSGQVAAPATRNAAQFLSALALSKQTSEQLYEQQQQESEWIASSCSLELSSLAYQQQESDIKMNGAKSRPPPPNGPQLEQQNDDAQEKLKGKQLSKQLDCLVYANVDWQARVRKEVFMPSESYDNPQVCQLIFAQLVADVFNPRHWTRLNIKERAALKAIMKDNSIGYSPGLPQIGQMEPIKRELVRMARTFGLYFTRPYQALNFACLSENLALFSGNQHHSLGSCGNSTASSSCSSNADTERNLSPGEDERRRQATTSELGSERESLAFRLAGRLRAKDNLATGWIDMVAVHHSGLRLVALVNNTNENSAELGDNKQPASGQPNEWQLASSLRHSGASWRSASRQLGGATPTPGSANAAAGLGYKVLETLKFRDMTDVALVGARVLLVSMRNGKKCWMLSSNQANQLALLLKGFHSDYNNEHSSRQTSAKERQRPATKNVRGQQARNQQKESKAPGEERQKRQQNALLASDDDHDGDHFEERQVANRVGKLHQAHDPDNVLADPKRILSDNLAAHCEAPGQQHRGGSGKSSATSSNNGRQRGEQHSNFSGGRLNSKPSAPESANSSELLRPRSAIAGAANSIDIGDGGQQRGPTKTTTTPSGGGLGGGTGSGSGGGRHRYPKAPASTHSAPAVDCDGQQQQVTGAAVRNKAIKRASLWQNSLSRMSNTFNLFAGGGSVAARRQQLDGKLAKQQQDEEAANQQQQVALDAWIETKVDFDDDEEEEEHEEQEVEGEKVGQEEASKTSKEETRPSSLQSADTETNSSKQEQQNDRAKLADDKQTVAKQRGDEDGKYSMLQFALYSFREAIDKYSVLLKQQKSGYDTSTLRGSLKLIESFRNGGGASGGDDSHSTIGLMAGGTLKSIASSTMQTASNEWTWRELAEMVKFTRKPLKRSLLRLPQQDDLERRALECFRAIMQYMGDLNGSTTTPGNTTAAPATEVECVYLILINCHNYPILRDEIYCQLIKQVTNNRQQPGSQVDSCLRGWRLFSIVAAYFDCSSNLRPYLVKYLEQAAYDKRRAYHSVAMLCLLNLRKTFKYKGRKNVPSIEEIAATSAGRNSKRQIYRLPGGTERVINTKSTTVVDDIIQEICTQMLGVTERNEMLEFSLYCIADGDLYTMPLNRDEYILDITTELVKNHQQYFLIFCRSIWHFPLRLDSKLYIELTFNQIAPDYLEGLLLVLPSSFSAQARRQNRSQGPASGGQKQQQHLKLQGKLVREIARIAALLHRASGTDYMPHKDEIKYLLPKPIVAAIKKQQRIQGSEELVAPCAPSLSSSSTASSSSMEAHDKLTATTPQDSIAPSAQHWIELVQGFWSEMSAFDTLDAKAQFLDIVRHWPLFGSSFFAIKLIQRDLIQPMDFILALNKLGIQMLDTVTHKTVHRFPFNEVVSTRKVRSEDGALFLDMKCGNLMKRTIIRIQTDQAHEISRLIRQYVDIELLQASKNGTSTPPSVKDQIFEGK